MGQLTELSNHLFGGDQEPASGGKPIPVSDLIPPEGDSSTSAKAANEPEFVDRKQKRPFKLPPDPALGIRNNNPGNIEKSKDNWVGMSSDQTGDDRFIKFQDPKYGIRAIGRVLNTYQEAHNLKTVNEMIERWAPPYEMNDDGTFKLDANGNKITENPSTVSGDYQRHVAETIGVDPDEPIDVKDRDILARAVEAIIKHENGQQPYPVTLIQEGLALSGIKFNKDSKPQQQIEDKE